MLGERVHGQDLRGSLRICDDDLRDGERPAVNVEDTGEVVFLRHVGVVVLRVREGREHAGYFFEELDVAPEERVARGLGLHGCLLDREKNF